MLRIVTPACAAIFGVALAGNSAPAHAGSYHQVYAFHGRSGNYKDGNGPVAGVIKAGGRLYGTTSSGGAYGKYGKGTVFSLDPKSGTETVVYSFKPKADGTQADANLLNVGGRLYGTSEDRGADGFGTVFSVNPNTGAERVLYSFAGSPDGGVPYAGLIDVNGTLYGTTAGGGSNASCGFTNGCGTVFSFNPTKGAEKTIYSFSGLGGVNPTASLLNRGGTLYGTTYNGGTGGTGTVFALNPMTGAAIVLHSFPPQDSGGSNDGAYPYAGLLDVGGVLYGTTLAGGRTLSFSGTVFSVNPKTGGEKLVYSFQGGSGDGAAPLGGLIKVGDTLYGTTYGGGVANCPAGCGTIFSINLKTGAERVQYFFQAGLDGFGPEAGLINDHGTLYGTTVGGGLGYGTVFSYTP